MIAAATAGASAQEINLASQAGANAAANNFVSHSPFANVKTLVAKENARLTAACEPNCTAEDFRRIDQQAAAVERAAELVEVAKRSVITPDQATQLAQTLVEIAPFYGTAESALQLITGQSSLTGEEANRIWAAVGLVPLAGGMVRKVGESVVETLTALLRAADGPVFKTTKEATLTAAELAATQAALTQKAADARALLPSSIRNSGNMGVAEIDVPGVQSSMAASSRANIPNTAQQAQGFVGKVPETFPSSNVMTRGNDPVFLDRSADSEAKILNNIAAQLGDKTSAAGTVNLFTERAPCTSCSDVIQQFQAKYPNIKINVYDNGGRNVSPTRKGY